MIGLEKGKVKLAEFDNKWAVYFQREKTSILELTYPFHLLIEHVGSTSIDDLCAKPIIDILIGIDKFEHGFNIFPKFEAIGYEFKGENGIPERHFFAKGNPRTHHIHMVEKNGEFWMEHLLFRNYLRRNSRERKKYAELKLTLAKLYPEDREKYTNSKAEFIQYIINRAREEEGGEEKNGL